MKSNQTSENNCDNHDLVDILDIEIDKTLPKSERISEFVRLVKTPHRFKCGDCTFDIIYAKNGLCIEDCLRGAMS